MGKPKRALGQTGRDGAHGKRAGASQPKAPSRAQRGKTSQHSVALTIDKRITDAVRDKWAAAVAHADEGNPGASLAAMLGEALMLAALYDAHFKASVEEDGRAVPGLSQVSERSVLDENTGHELVELVLAAAKVHAEAVSTSERLAASPMQRAEWVLRELKATMEYVFEEGSQAALGLEKIVTSHPRPSSQDEMASALEAYRGLGKAHRAELEGIAGFELALLDEALELATALRQRSGERLLAQAAASSRDLLPTRNRLLDAVRERVKRIRQAARYVFRNDPDLARRFSSDYQRGRRSEHRKKGRKAGVLDATST